MLDERDFPDMEDQTKKIETPHYKGKPVRPENRNLEEAAEKTSQASQSASKTSTEAHSTGQTGHEDSVEGKSQVASNSAKTAHSARTEGDEMDALTRRAEQEERLKRRERALQKAQATHKVSKTPVRKQAPGKQNAKTQQTSQKAAQKENAAAARSDIPTMVTVVISVMVLLLLLWFMATTFMSTMGRRSGVAVDDTQAESSVEDGASETADASEDASEEVPAVGAETSEEAVPDPLTEGDADFREPDTWIGKTFAVKDDANVRSGAGTANSILGNVDPGDTVVVYRAETADDATWVQGKITKRDGMTLEGWIYAYAIDPTAR